MKPSVGTVLLNANYTKHMTVRPIAVIFMNDNETEKEHYLQN